MKTLTVWNKRTHQEADGTKVRELIESGKVFINGWMDDEGGNMIWIEIYNAPGFELREKE